MWYLKLVDHAGRETIHPCDHFVVTRYLPGSAVLADFVKRFGGTEQESAGIEVQLIERRGVDEATQKLIAEGEGIGRACDLAELRLEAAVEAKVMAVDVPEGTSPIGLLAAGRLPDVERELSDEQRAALGDYRKTLEEFVRVHRALQEKDVGVSKQTLHVPRHGPVIYVMNEKGDVVDGYRWPPRKQQTQTIREARHAAGTGSRR